MILVALGFWAGVGVTVTAGIVLYLMIPEEEDEFDGAVQEAERIARKVAR